jgi:hypothetical protein
MFIGRTRPDVTLIPFLCRLCMWYLNMLFKTFKQSEKSSYYLRTGDRTPNQPWQAVFYPNYVRLFIYYYNNQNLSCQLNFGYSKFQTI